MDIKRNISFWLIIVFMTLLQIYYFHVNRGLEIPFPAINRIQTFMTAEELYMFDYLALMVPVLVYIFFLIEWEEFYIDYYGVIQIIRSKNMFRYMGKLYRQMMKQAFLFTMIVFLLNYISDFNTVNVTLWKLLFLVADYYITIFALSACVLLICMLMNKMTAIICSITMVIGIVLISKTIDRSIINVALFVNHIVRQPQGIQSIIIGLIWIFLFYIISVYVVEKKEYMRR